MADLRPRVPRVDAVVDVARADKGRRRGMMAVEPFRLTTAADVSEVWERRCAAELSNRKAAAAFAVADRAYRDALAMYSATEARSRLWPAPSGNLCLLLAAPAAAAYDSTAGTNPAEKGSL